MRKSKSLLLFLSFLTSLLFLSCDSKSIPSLLGTWEAEITLKSELGGKDAPEGLEAFLFTKQKITLSFAEGGVYTKHVVQQVDRFESNQKIESTEEEKAYFSQFFDKDLTFDGEYSQKKSFIVFTVERVQSAGEESLSYMDYFVKDPSIGEDEITSNYEMKDGFLVLDEVKFKKM